MTIKTAVKAMVLLAVYGAALALALLAHRSYLYGNVSTIAVSDLSDLDEVFVIDSASLRVRNREFTKVCFAGDSAYALKDARQWFDPKDTQFTVALRAAGGPADAYNDDNHSSIALLSHTSALILQLAFREGLSVVNFGCANVDAGDIEIRSYKTNSSLEFFLPNATLKSPRTPPANLCAERLERFVASIEELFVEKVERRARAWAAIRRYLPATGCNVDEVGSIVRKSKFFKAPTDGTDSTIRFEDSDIRVQLRMERNAGRVGDPSVILLGVPSL
ncbi:MAG: hypothetical protein JWR80_4952 [Bradyrhizobium sp.]|nr:hypothetical protein [Bradyrhizobium sp.]